jgi:hypothetical protein
MPQLIGIIVGGVAAWAGYRWMSKEWNRVQADLRDADEVLKKREEKAVPTLQQDPETGVYRPDKS